MYDITIQDIEYFLMAAEKLSFTEAAQSLFSSQPVISKCIKRLENELGFKLFNRDNRGVTLTLEGATLHDKWRYLMYGFYEGIESAQSVINEGKKYINIGCLSEFEHEIGIKEFIQCYEEKYPDISVTVEIYGFKELRDQLISGNCDLIISYNGELDDLKDVRQKDITKIDHYIAISKKHSLAHKEDLKLQDLNNETFYILSPSESNKSVNRILDAFKSVGFRPRRIGHIPNMSSLAFAVSQGKGVTICNRLITRGYENEIKLIPYKDLFKNICLAVAWKKDSITPELQNLVNMI